MSQEWQINIIIFHSKIYCKLLASILSKQNSTKKHKDTFFIFSTAFVGHLALRIKIYLSLFPIYRETSKIWSKYRSTFKQSLWNYHYVESVRIRSFSGPYICAFGLNTELRRYGISFRIQSEYRKYGKTPNTDTFHAMNTDRRFLTSRNSDSYLSVTQSLKSGTNHVALLVLLLWHCLVVSPKKNSKVVPDTELGSYKIRSPLLIWPWIYCRRELATQF